MPTDSRWQGDQEDDCTLEVNGYMAHCEVMYSLRVNDEDEGDEFSYEDAWYVGVYGPNNEQVFHSGEPGGNILGGDMARSIGECIVDLAAEVASTQAELERVRGLLMSAYEAMCGLPTEAHTLRLMSEIAAAINS